MHNLKVFSRTIVRKNSQIYTYVPSEKTMEIEQTSSSRACSLRSSTPIHRLRQPLRSLWRNKRGTEWPSFYGKRDFIKKTTIVSFTSEYCRLKREWKWISSLYMHRWKVNAPRGSLRGSFDNNLGSTVFVRGWFIPCAARFNHRCFRLGSWLRSYRKLEIHSR